MLEFIHFIIHRIGLELHSKKIIFFKYISISKIFFKKIKNIILKNNTPTFTNT